MSRAAKHEAYAALLKLQEGGAQASPSSGVSPRVESRGGEPSPPAGSWATGPFVDGDGALLASRDSASRAGNAESRKVRHANRAAKHEAFAAILRLEDDVNHHEGEAPVVPAGAAPAPSRAPPPAPEATARSLGPEPDLPPPRGAPPLAQSRAAKHEAFAAMLKLQEDGASASTGATRDSHPVAAAETTSPPQEPPAGAWATGPFRDGEGRLAAGGGREAAEAAARKAGGRAARHEAMAAMLKLEEEVSRRPVGAAGAQNELPPPPVEKPRSLPPPPPLPPSQVEAGADAVEAAVVGKVAAPASDDAAGGRDRPDSFEAPGGAGGVDPVHEAKVQRVFEAFDKDRDGVLRREEMAALVLGVNPIVHFTPEQIEVILEEVFRTYAEHIERGGLTPAGLRKTYADGAGDIDRDFDALGLRLPGVESPGQQPLPVEHQAPPLQLPDPSRDAGAAGGEARPEPGRLVINEAPPPGEPKRATAPAEHLSRGVLQQPGGEGAGGGSEKAAEDGSSSLPGGGEGDDEDAGLMDQLLDSEGEEGEEGDKKGTASEPPLQEEEATPPAPPKAVVEEEARPRDLPAGFGVHSPPATPPPRAMLGSGAYMGPEGHRLLRDLEALLDRDDAEQHVGGRGYDYAATQQALAELRHRVDVAPLAEEEAYDVHCEMGRVLAGRSHGDEALLSYQRAVALMPDEALAHFRMGNVHYMVGETAPAKESFEKSLRAADPVVHESLLPKCHVNLGIALEREGMLMCALEHYREAAILDPGHHRALKLLGSALYGLGELRAAEEALRHALHLHPEFADARCDLGCTLLASRDVAGARESFEAAIALDPQHVGALYNLGNLLREGGDYAGASERYRRALQSDRYHWRSMLNMGMAELAQGHSEEGAKCLKAAFKMTGERVELYDAIKHIRRMMRDKHGRENLHHMLEKSGLHNAEDHREGVVYRIEPERFTLHGGGTSPREWVAVALDIRSLQRTTRVGHCPLSAVRREASDANLPQGPAHDRRSKAIRKAALERILRGMLQHETGQLFQLGMKAINERLLSVLDPERGGLVDLGMFLACVAPICEGAPAERRRVVYETLLWRQGGGGQQAGLPRGDVELYLRTMRRVYWAGHGGAGGAGDGAGEDTGAGDGPPMGFPEFCAMFADAGTGFPVLGVLEKLESLDRERHAGIKCSVCTYSIVGPRYACKSHKFSLCSTCYAEGKVPASVLQSGAYPFKEHVVETAATRLKHAFRMG